MAGRLAFGQDSTPAQSWTSSSQQESPSETWNPIRTHQIHTERDGRVLEQTAVETIGLDGRYVPYMDTERESVRVDATTVRSLERTFARGPNGEKTLVQERSEETISLPKGAHRIVRTVANPDVNGALQVVQEEFIDSKQVNTGARETKSIVLMPDPNEGLAPVMQQQEIARPQVDGTTDVERYSWLTDGAGHWQLKEVRRGIHQDGGNTREESVLRTDSAGTLQLVEQTIRTQTKLGADQDSEISETYSTTVPGVAGENNLQIVRRESVRRRHSASENSVARQVESVTPGSTSGNLHPTELAVDIVRPTANSVFNDHRTIYSIDANGQLRQVWTSVGETDKSLTVDFNGQAPQ